jgi:hypothetical protein
MSWVVMCSDGGIRHPPYGNEDDARFDAGLFDVQCDRGTTMIDHSHPPCPGGKHRIVLQPQEIKR